MLSVFRSERFYEDHLKRVFKELQLSCQSHTLCINNYQVDCFAKKPSIRIEGNVWVIVAVTKYYRIRKSLSLSEFLQSPPNKFFISNCLILKRCVFIIVLLTLLNNATGSFLVDEPKCLKYYTHIHNTKNNPL